MKDNRKVFIRLVKKKITFMLSLLILLLLGLAAAQYSSFRFAGNVSSVSGGLEEQKLLVQGLSRDISSMYVVMEAAKGSGRSIDEQQAGLIASLDETLKAQYRQYSKQAEAFGEGYLLFEGDRYSLSRRFSGHDELLAAAGQEAATFLRLLSQAAGDGAFTDLTASMVEEIKAAEQALTEQYDQLQSLLARQSAGRVSVDILISAVLFLLAAGALIFTVIQLKQAIVLPLDVIYNEFSQDSTELKELPPRELMPLVMEIREELDKRNKLVELVSSLSYNTSFHEVLEYIYSTFSAFIPYNHIGIALLKNRGTVLEASYSMSDDILAPLSKKLLGIRARISTTSLEEVINAGRPRVINNLEQYLEGRPPRPYNEIILEEGIRASITLPLKVNNQPMGVIFFSSVTRDIYTAEHVRFLETLADSIAVCFSQNIFIDELLISGLTALAKLVESRDEDTGNHLERMKEYSRAIAGFLSVDNCYPETISADFIRDINNFSPMHDIGKVGVRDEILLKPGKLTPEEFEEMKKHPKFGADVLRTAEASIERQNRSMFKMGIEIAEGHHEKWNGSGYPYGKSGQSIPLSARIVAVADVLDALTSKRPYKRAFPFEESFEIIVSDSGRHFDPVIVDSLIRHKSELYELYLLFQSELSEEQESEALLAGVVK